MLDGVTIAESKAQKDELLLTGNDIENVSQSGSSARPSSLAVNTDRFP
jgi:large subunit ribosomal protein L9e